MARLKRRSSNEEIMDENIEFDDDREPSELEAAPSEEELPFEIPRD